MSLPLGLQIKALTTSIIYGIQDAIRQRITKAAFIRYQPRSHGHRKLEKSDPFLYLPFIPGKGNSWKRKFLL